MRKGFTLIELLVVIGILAVLGSVISLAIKGKSERVETERETTRSFKYRISDINGKNYYTQSYLEQDNCVSFENSWSGFVKICGNYTILIVQPRNL